PFMLVARVRRLVRDSARVRLEDDVDDVAQRYVMMMRTFVIAPAQMHAHAIGRNARERMIEPLDMELDRLAEVGEGQILELDVAAHREIWTVDLHDKSGVVDGVILDTHRVAKRADISLVTRV